MIVAWRISGTWQWDLLATPILPLALWAFVRLSTLAEGMIVPKRSTTADPDTARFIGFVMLGLFVSVAGNAAFEVFLRHRLTHPDAVLIVGAIIWSGVAIFVIGNHAEREDRREREAADLAAQARGESGSP